MAYEPPGYNAVDFDFTETGYSAPVYNAVDFDFASAELVLVPVFRMSLLGPHPVYLPIQVSVGGISVVVPRPRLNVPERVPVPAFTLRLIPAENPLPRGIVDVQSGGLGLVGAQPNMAERMGVAAGYLTITPQPVGQRHGLHLPASGIVRVLSPMPSAVKSLTTYPGLARMALRSLAPHYLWAPSAGVAGQTIYRCYLDDLLLPVSSMQIRRRDGEPTYIAVTVPSADYDVDEAAIISRAGGAIIVYRGHRFQDGREQLEELERVVLESFSGSEMAVSSELNLNGHRTVTNNSPKTMNLTGASYRNLTDGKRRYRCAPDNFLRPGDTAVINGESLTVASITYTIGTDGERMEVAE
jgi:hypothetical protein